METRPALQPLRDVQPGVEDELRRVVRELRSELVAREPAVRLGKDSEDLHRMRVATRRLRSTLRSARGRLAEADGTDELRDELRWIAALLGEVRDRDVLIEYLLQELATVDEGAAFGAILEHLDAEREQARRDLVAALDSPRYRALVARLEHAPALREGETLARVAADEYRRLRRSMRKLGEEASDEELHRARIRVKRARYAAEAAHAPARFVKRAKELQDLLGEHQDAAAAEERIRGLVAAVRGTGRTAFAAGRLVERQRVRRSRARAAWPTAWKRLEKVGDKAYLR